MRAQLTLTRLTIKNTKKAQTYPRLCASRTPTLKRLAVAQLKPPRVLALAVTSVFALGACQSTPSQEFRFTTHITDDGYKLFQLAYPPAVSEIRLPGSDRRPRRETETTERQALAELEQRLVRSNYCRQGYVLLGRHAGQTSSRIRGECREKATPEDLRLFPDTLDQW